MNNYDDALDQYAQEQIPDSQIQGQSTGPTAPTTTPPKSPQDTANNPYLRIIDAGIQQQQQRSHAALAVGFSVDSNPDRSAVNAILARRYNVPPAVVDVYPDDFKRRAAIETANNALQNAPTLTQAISNNPDLARIVHDDLHPLATMEETIQALSNINQRFAARDSISPAFQNTAASDAPPSIGEQFSQWMRDALGITNHSLAQAQLGHYAQGNNTDLSAMNTAMGGMQRPAADLLSQFPGGFTQGATAGIVPNPAGDPTTALGAVSNAVGTLAGFMLGAPLKVGGLATDWLLGRYLAPAANESALAAGTKYIGDLVARLGLATGISKTGEAIDSPDVSTGAGKVGQGALSGAEAGAAFGAAGKLLPESNPAQWLARFLGVSSALDLSEGKAPFSDLANLQNMTPVEQANTLTNYLLNGLFTAHGAPRLGTPIANTIEAQKATATQQTLAQLGDAAALSKTRERDPERFQQLVAAMTDGNEVKNLYVNGNDLANVLRQSNVTPEQIATRLPEVAAQISESTNTNGDVRIPVADYATHLAGTPVDEALRPHLKVDPEGMTAAEADKFFQEQKDVNLDTIVADARKTFEEQAQNRVFHESSQNVGDAIADQLQGAGRSPGEAKSAAQLYQAFYTTLAKRTGMLPQEAMAAHPIQFGTEGIGEGYGQGGEVLGKATPDRKASTLDDAVNAAAEFVGKPLHNESTGLDAVVSKKTLGKMTSKSASEKSTSLADHALAIANVDKLFAHALLDETHVDKRGEPTIVGIHRYVAPMIGADGNVAAVKMTVKETRHPSQPNPLYSIETIDVEKPALLAPSQEGIEPKPGVNDVAESRTGGLGEKVLQSIRDVKQLLEQNARGSFDPTSSTIQLFKNADLSTLLHETGHFFLETMAKVAKTSPDMAKDMDAALKWMGVKGGQDAWDKMTLSEKREPHEQFARGFEAYLMEGKAPNVEMQGIFSRFKAWLMHVYQSVKALNVELSPEIRQVFDRLLASEDQIKHAEAVRGYSLLFSGKPEGMTDAEYAEYQKLPQEAQGQALEELQARSLRDMKWLSGAKSKALRALQTEAKRTRNKIREDVADAVMQSPIERARSWLSEWGQKSSVDKDALAAWKESRNVQQKAVDAAVKQEYLSRPEATNLNGIEKGQYLAKNKRVMANEVERRVLAWEQENQPPRKENVPLDMDIVAEVFGFRDGKTLAEALKDTPSAKEVINAQTDQRMLEEHGELVSKQDLERAAEAAIHNEVRARIMATELKTLAKLNSPTKLLTRAAREAADAEIAKRKVSDLDPRQYTASEARNARAAEKALAKGDTVGAAQATRAKLLSNQLAKASIDAAAEVQKGLTYLKRFNKPSVREKLDVAFRDQIDGILSRYDLRRGNPEKLADRDVESLNDFVERLAAMNFAIDVPERMVSNFERTHYKNLTVEEFRGMVDAIKSIDHIGREVQRVHDGNEQRMLDEVANEVEQQTEQLHTSEPETNRGLTAWQKRFGTFKSVMRSIDASLMKVEAMCDILDRENPFGLFNRFVFRKIAKAAGDKADLEKKVTALWEEALHSLPEDIVKDGRKRIEMEGAIDGRTGKTQLLDWSGKMAVAGYRGDAQGFDKLCRGEGWDPQVVLRFLDRYMRPEEWKAIQKIASSFQALYPLKQAMLRRLGQTSPVEVPCIPFKTPYGEMPGWYWPIKYDPARSYTVRVLDAKREVSRLEDNFYNKADTSTGREITRNSKYAKPMLLSLDAYPRVIIDEIRDITMREALIESDRFLAHPLVRQSVIKGLSEEHYDQMQQWLGSIANDGATKPTQLQWLDNALLGYVPEPPW